LGYEKTFRWFRKIAFAEGVSFIVLLFIAMPLKYFAHQPLAVNICGGIQGVLFVGLAILAREVKSDYKKNFNWLVKAGLASIIPFGTFYKNRQWKKEEAVITAV